MNAVHNILFTRTTDIDGAVKEKLKQMGIHTTHLPLIEITPVPLTPNHQQQIVALNDYHFVIFISQWAALYGMQAIQLHWKNTLPPLTWCAIGPTTETILKNQHPSLITKTILLPQDPPFESETFLMLPEMNENIQNKKVMIFRGMGGRELLINSLKTRGAVIQTIEVYERRLSDNIDLAWDNLSSSLYTYNLIVITSAHALNHLLILSSKNNTIKEWIKNIPLLVVGERMLSLAKENSFRQLILTNGADDQTLTAALLEWFKIN